MKKSENVLENAVLEEGTRGGRMLEALQHCRMLHNDIDYSLVQLFIIAIGVYVHVRASAHARSIQYVRARACRSSCKLRRQLPALAAWFLCASDNGVFRSSLVCAFLKKEILNIDVKTFLRKTESDEVFLVRNDDYMSEHLVLVTG